MLFQEDIMEYFEFVAQEMREKNLPILNFLVHDYPGFISKEDVVPEDEESEEEDLETA